MWGGFGGGMMWPMMMGGMGGGFGLDYLYPWLNNSQHISDGFRDQTLQTGITGLQNSVTAGFGDVQNALCSGFAGTTAAITGAQNAIAQQMYGNEIASLNRSFAEQTANTQGFNNMQSQLAQCCCDNKTSAMQNTRDILDNQTRNTQAILDKLCQLELDGVKQNYENRIAGMQNVIDGLNAQVNSADRRVAMGEEIDALYNRLNNCPIPATPVYGRTPIFTCGGQNTGCGCGGNAFMN